MSTVVVLCASALVLRVPLRSLYWASRVTAAKTNEDFAAHVTLLCRAGDAGRWGTVQLLRHPDAAIRQTGVLILHHGRGSWSRGELLNMLCNEDAATADLAAVGVALRRREYAPEEIRELCRSKNTCQASGVIYAISRSFIPGDEECISMALEANPNIAVVAEAIDALESIATSGAAAVLLGLLDDARSLEPVTRRQRIGTRALVSASPGPVAHIARGPDTVRSNVPQIDMDLSPTAQDQEATPAASVTTVCSAAARVLGRISGMPAKDELHPSLEEIARWRAWVASQENR